MPTPIVQRLILLCGGLLIVLMGAGPAHAQFPALPGADQPVPEAAQETLDALTDTSGLTINTAKGCCKPSIWDFLGVHEVHEHLHETLVSIGELPLFAGLQKAIMLPALQMVGLAPPSAGGPPLPGAGGPAGGPTPAGGAAGAGGAGPGGAPSSAAVAAQIQADEAEADAKIQVIEFLGQQDCNRYPELVPALLADLDHPVERVRYAVLLALQKQCKELRCSTLTGTRILFKMHHRQFMPVCRQCTSCACQQQVIKRLSDLLLDQNALGHPREQSPRVRQLAGAILERCLQMHPPDPATAPPPALEEVQPDPVPPPLPDPVLFPAPAADTAPIQQTGYEAVPRREPSPRRGGPSAFLKKIFRWPGRSKFETSLVLPEADIIAPGTIVRAQNLDLDAPADPFMTAGGWRNASANGDSRLDDSTRTSPVAGWTSLPATGPGQNEPQTATVESPVESLPLSDTVTEDISRGETDAAESVPVEMNSPGTATVDAETAPATTVPASPGANTKQPPTQDASPAPADPEAEIRNAARAANELFPHRNGPRQAEFVATVERLVQLRLERALRGDTAQGEKLLAEASGLCQRDPGSPAAAVAMETLSRYLESRARQAGAGQPAAIRKYAACLRYMAAQFDSPSEATARRLLDVATALDSIGDGAAARTAREHVVEFFPNSTLAATARQHLATADRRRDTTTTTEQTAIVPVAHKQAPSREADPRNIPSDRRSTTRQTAATHGGRVIANQPVELPPLPDAVPVPTRPESVLQRPVDQPAVTESVESAPVEQADPKTQPKPQRPTLPVEEPEPSAFSQPEWVAAPDSDESQVEPAAPTGREESERPLLLLNPATEPQRAADMPPTTPAEPVVTEPAGTDVTEVSPATDEPPRVIHAEPTRERMPAPGHATAEVTASSDVDTSERSMPPESTAAASGVSKDPGPAMPAELPVIPEPAQIDDVEVAPVVVRPQRARSRPRIEIATSPVADVTPEEFVRPEPVVEQPIHSAERTEEEPHVEPEPTVVSVRHVPLEMAPLPGIEGPRSLPVTPLQPTGSSGPALTGTDASSVVAEQAASGTEAEAPASATARMEPTPALPAGPVAVETPSEIVEAGALAVPTTSLLAVPANFEAALEESSGPDLVTAGYVEQPGTVHEPYFEPVPLPNDVYERAQQALEANYEAEFYVQENDDILDRYDNTVGIQLSPHSLFEIDPAVPANMNRIRFKSMIGYKLPDRSEYLWSKIGGRGPKQTESQLDIHQITIYSEKGSDTASAFFEIPITMLDPFNNSNTAGPGDMVIGAKSVMLQDENWVITSLMRTYTPIGTPRRGLGRGHLSLEPGVAVQWRWGRRTYMYGNMKFHFPIAANFDFGGEVLITGIGFTRVLLTDPVSPPVGRSWALVMTSETIITSFLDGLMTLPNGTVVDAEGSVAVQNLGLRYIWTKRFSTGFSMGVPISSTELFDMSILTEFQWIY